MLPQPPATLADEAMTESPEYQAFRRFAQLTAHKRELNEQLHEMQKQMDALEPVLLAYLTQNGLEMIKVEGFTMAPAREPWIYPKAGLGRPQVCEALKLSGLGRMVTENYNTRTLTKYVRELEEHRTLLAPSDSAALGELLPAPLAQVVEVRPGYRLQVLDRRTAAKGLSHPFEEESDL